MSVNIFHKTGSGTGTLQKVAGNTVILDANVSEIRNGNFSLSITSTAGYFRTTVTFATPMPDTDYIVNLEVDTADYLVSNITPLIIDQKTVNGFRINWYGQAGSGVSGVISGKYYAFKPIPMDGYTELQNKVNNPDNTPTKDSNNLVKSGGVWDALKDAGTVFTGTKAEWEALDPTDQERYEVVCITDDEESGGGGVPTISETGSFPGQANQFPKIVTLQNNFKKLYSFHQIGIPGSGWIAGWEFEAPNTVKVYPYTVYEGNYTPINGGIFSFDYEAIGE